VYWRQLQTETTTTAAYAAAPNLNVPGAFALATKSVVLAHEIDSAFAMVCDRCSGYGHSAARCGSPSAMPHVGYCHTCKTRSHAYADCRSKIDGRARRDNRQPRRDDRDRPPRRDDRDRPPRRDGRDHHPPRRDDRDFDTDVEPVPAQEERASAQAERAYYPAGGAARDDYYYSAGSAARDDYYYSADSAARDDYYYYSAGSAAYDNYNYQSVGENSRNDDRRNGHADRDGNQGRADVTFPTDGGAIFLAEPLTPTIPRASAQAESASAQAERASAQAESAPSPATTATAPPNDDRRNGHATHGGNQGRAEITFPTDGGGIFLAGHSNCDAHGRPDCYADRDVHGHSGCFSDCVAHDHSDRDHSDRDDHGSSDRDADHHTDLWSHGRAHGDPVRDAYRDAHGCGGQAERTSVQAERASAQAERAMTQAEPAPAQADPGRQTSTSRDYKNHGDININNKTN
jgi:hypothetical protein